MGTPTRASPKLWTRQAKWAGRNSGLPSCESLRQTDHLIILGPQALFVPAAGSICVGMTDDRPWDEGESGSLAFFP
jgi:hypothetical protein